MNLETKKIERTFQEGKYSIEKTVGLNREVKELHSGAPNISNFDSYKLDKISSGTSREFDSQFMNSSSRHCHIQSSVVNSRVNRSSQNHNLQSSLGLKSRSIAKFHFRNSIVDSESESRVLKNLNKSGYEVEAS